MPHVLIGEEPYTLSKPAAELVKSINAAWAAVQSRREKHQAAVARLNTGRRLTAADRRAKEELADELVSIVEEEIRCLDRLGTEWREVRARERDAAAERAHTERDKAITKVVKQLEAMGFDAEKYAELVTPDPNVHGHKERCRDRCLDAIEHVATYHPSIVPHNNAQRIFLALTSDDLEPSYITQRIEALERQLAVQTG